MVFERFLRVQGGSWEALGGLLGGSWGVLWASSGGLGRSWEDLARSGSQDDPNRSYVSRRSSSHVVQTGFYPSVCGLRLKIAFIVGFIGKFCVAWYG